MSRAMPTPPPPPPAEPGPEPDADVPVYHFDPNFGNPRDTYRRADEVHPDARQPEVAGVFVAIVEGEKTISTMWGRRSIPWRAEPGTRCVILGYWSDGTVHLRWPAIAGAYRVDGRFPAWVVAPDPTTVLVGGGHMLLASSPPILPERVPTWFVVALIVVVLVALVLLIPATRDFLLGLV